MALWGKSTSAASRPKFVVDNTDAQGSAGAREDVYATTGGWVQTSGKGHSGNDNSSEHQKYWFALETYQAH